MRSPFPGMDPFLELYWGDVRHRLITYMADAVQPGLPGDLRARVEERVFVDADREKQREIIPVVHIAETEGWRGGGGGGTAVLEEVDVDVEVAEPMLFELQDVEVTEGFIEIRERGGARVVTVIEVLSPSNKRKGEGRKKYLKKQREVLASDASLVEIDLLRGGKRTLAVTDIPTAHARDALVCISPGWRRSRRELYALPFASKLPNIPIPLRPQEKPILVDLQALVDHVYDAGRYSDIDYTQPLEPPLSVEQEAWLKTLLETRKSEVPNA